MSQYVFNSKFEKAFLKNMLVPYQAKLQTNLVLLMNERSEQTSREYYLHLKDELELIQTLLNRLTEEGF